MHNVDFSEVTNVAECRLGSATALFAVHVADTSSRLHADPKGKIPMVRACTNGAYTSIL